MGGDDKVMGGEGIVVDIDGKEKVEDEATGAGTAVTKVEAAVEGVEIKDDEDGVGGERRY